MRNPARKVVAVLAVAAFIFTRAPVRPAEGSLVEIAAEMTALVVEVGLLLEALGAIAKQYSEIQKTTEHIVDRGIAEQQFDTTMYGHDHRALSSGNRFDLSGVTGEFTNAYASLSASGGVSFSRSGLSQEALERFINGRAGARTRGDYPGDHAKRGGDLKNYGVGVMEGNDRDIDRLIRYKNEALKMMGALFDGTAAGSLKAAWDKEYNTLSDYYSQLPYKAAAPNKFKSFDGSGNALKTDVLTGPGYRRVLQAAGQAANLKNHMMTGVRVIQSRQLEADLKYAHNEQQERAERHFSFEEAVGSWNASSAAAGY